MVARVESHGGTRKGRGRPPAIQARRPAPSPVHGGGSGWGERGRNRATRICILLLAAALPACSSDRLRDIDPRPAFANLFGAHLDGREPPPGLDRPYPNLSTVPNRPVPPSIEIRERLSASLATDRDRSRTALNATGRAPTAPAGAAPPGPPRLAAVPPIRLDPAPAPAPAAQPVPAPRPAPTPAAPIPAAPDPVVPPAPPARDLLAPPPAPSRDLLAPRAN